SSSQELTGAVSRRGLARSMGGAPHCVSATSSPQARPATRGSPHGTIPAGWRGRPVSGEPPAAGWSARELVEADARYFLHQAASTPGLSAVRRASGVWVEDVDGRRVMDFHGNSVHHLGYAHPTLIAALKAQLDNLTFSPRRFTNEVAIALARRL